MSGKYDHLDRVELIRLLEKRDRGRRLGLIWERDEIEADRAVDPHFIACDVVEELCERAAPWRNLIIEGDNHDALRWLRMTHAGRVKCIYIDPPYNTGAKDWVYNDHFVDTNDRYRHSTWLEFLYQRFLLARDLLTEDGVILVSINDENRAKLELLMEEALPGMNLGSLTWRSRTGSNDAKGAFLSKNHEHVLVFGNSGFRFGGTEKTYENYANPDNDPNGDWFADNLTQAKDQHERPNAFYPIQDPRTGIWYPCNPERVWTYPSRARLKKGQKIRTKPMEEWIEAGQVLFPKNQRIERWTTLDDLIKAIRDKNVPLSGGVPMIREDLPDLKSWIGRQVGFGIPNFKRYRKDLKTATKPLST
ncbi:MAG: site-specific DNA-methyltransferase, partial [Alphaproteobacteria bacterium]|nr:site-specific DNA-methyltransferase [Alphaproteobacteria bacterium]